MFVFTSNRLFMECSLMISSSISFLTSYWLFVSSDISYRGNLQCSCTSTYFALPSRWFFTCENIWQTMYLIMFYWDVWIHLKGITRQFQMDDRSNRSRSKCQWSPRSIQRADERWETVRTAFLFTNLLFNFRLMYPCILGNLIFVLGQVSSSFDQLTFDLLLFDREKVAPSTGL